MFNGKTKAITFSYDDGVEQDIRLIEILNRYHLKGTFNLSSELFGQGKWLEREGKRVAQFRITEDKAKQIYKGHEVAAHTLTHVRLPDIADDREVIRQVEQDRLNLSEIFGYEVCGMAYSCGGKNHDPRTVELIRKYTGIKYARVPQTSKQFGPQEDLYQFKATVRHHTEWDEMCALAEQFLELKSDEPRVLSIWGHAYEFDIYPERWKLFEEFCRMISGREDIFYGTNRDVLLSELK